MNNKKKKKRTKKSHRKINDIVLNVPSEELIVEVSHLKSIKGKLSRGPKIKGYKCDTPIQSLLQYILLL